jgi:hypothetical protein
MEEEENQNWDIDRIYQEFGGELPHGMCSAAEWVYLMRDLLERDMFGGYINAKDKSLDIMQLVLGLRSSVLLTEVRKGVYTAVAKIGMCLYRLEYMSVDGNKVCPACGVLWDDHDLPSCGYVYFRV